MREPAQKIAAKATRRSRHVILQSAERLFAARGFQSTTLREISSASGANGALVSYYFGNKEGLWDAVLERKIKDLETLLPAFESTKREPRAADLKRVLRELFAHVRADQSFHVLAMRSMLEDPALQHRLTKNLWRPFRDRLAQFIRSVSGGRLSPADANLRAHVVGGMLQQYANLRSFYFDELGDDPEQVLAEFEKYVLNSLLPEIIKG